MKEVILLENINLVKLASESGRIACFSEGLLASESGKKRERNVIFEKVPSAGATTEICANLVGNKKCPILTVVFCQPRTA